MLKAQRHSTASNQRLIQCIPLVNMPDIHLLSMILSNFHRLSCLFYWCDRFETLHGYYWYNGQPIVSISQFMKMKPEYHFKRDTVEVVSPFTERTQFFVGNDCIFVKLVRQLSFMLSPAINLLQTKQSEKYCDQWTSLEVHCCD